MQNQPIKMLATFQVPSRQEGKQAVRSIKGIQIPVAIWAFSLNLIEKLDASTWLKDHDGWANKRNVVKTNATKQYVR